MGKVLKAKHPKKRFARRGLKNLSRKWCFTTVCISFDSGLIISELFTYIKADINLKSACQNYLAQVGLNWQQLMPIQFDFMSVRHTDHHKNFRIASRIINELAIISF